MKVDTESDAMGFSPIKIQIVIESKLELLDLYHRLILDHKVLVDFIGVKTDRPVPTKNQTSELLHALEFHLKGMGA